MNLAVEKIRLEYLLNYPLHNIKGGEMWSDDIKKRLVFIGTLSLCALVLIAHIFTLEGAFYLLLGFVFLPFYVNYLVAFGKWLLFDTTYDVHRSNWTKILLLISFITPTVIIMLFGDMFFGFGLTFPVILFLGTRILALVFFCNVENGASKLEDIIFENLVIHPLNALQFLLFSRELREGRRFAVEQLAEAIEIAFPRVMESISGSLKGKNMCLFKNYWGTSPIYRRIYRAYPLLVLSWWVSERKRVYKKLTKTVSHINRKQLEVNEKKLPLLLRNDAEIV